MLNDKSIRINEDLVITGLIDPSYHIAINPLESRMFFYEDVLKDLKVDALEKAEKILAKFGVSSQSVEIWGSGKPKREFLWSEDMASACVFLMENKDFKNTFNPQEKEIRNTHINIGTGTDISIKELAEKIKKISGISEY